MNLSQKLSVLLFSKFTQEWDCGLDIPNSFRGRACSKIDQQAILQASRDWQLPALSSRVTWWAVVSTSSDSQLTVTTIQLFHNTPFDSPEAQQIRRL